MLVCGVGVLMDVVEAVEFNTSSALLQGDEVLVERCDEQLF